MMQMLMIHKKRKTSSKDQKTTYKFWGNEAEKWRKIPLLTIFTVDERDEKNWEKARHEENYVNCYDWKYF